ncbi:type IV pilus modification protein PilV [Pseudofulvimonas gallinarii]|jgi:type IV pilus assembly protein PilV|uniref:Type IV pilus assembly protein PilV n=1 Tax=Pseudofulvimonas gallinarii TaxID=634155 RepID=A0A4R3L349_9GAMM|nr:type IV pilus modification protein PilV [Pseudofulvimonas gallinarii]TCS94033.1 type IV pilus assembly protein PilV [Pseudofulvimonas gallinarii]
MINIPPAGCGRSRGFSLLEVLIALVVFSVGLLGLAAMMVSAVRGNHQAYHHSQAVYVATAMADGLRANLAAVNAGAYNTDWISTAGGNACTSCNATDLAARDLAAWAQMANQRLPGGEVRVQCNSIAPSGYAPAAYNGTCTLGVRWGEVGDTGQTQESSQRAFSWIIQP